jgi:hypothetical protein
MLYDARKDTTITAVLIRARALIADEKNFCQSGWGRDGKRCAVHAIFDAAAMPISSILVCDQVPAVKFLTQLCGFQLAYYNDRHTHREMLALFDRGIVAAGKL